MDQLHPVGSINDTHEGQARKCHKPIYGNTDQSKSTHDVKELYHCPTLDLSHSQFIYFQNL